MGFSIKCKCGATIAPERLVGLRLDQIPTECDACGHQANANEEVTSTDTAGDGDALPNGERGEARRAGSEASKDATGAEIPPLSMEEIDNEVKAYRRERRQAAGAGQTK